MPNLIKGGGIGSVGPSKGVSSGEFRAARREQVKIMVQVSNLRTHGFLDFAANTEYCSLFRMIMVSIAGEAIVTT